MRDNMIEVVMGEFTVGVPRHFLVNPSDADHGTYQNCFRSLEEWQGSLMGARRYLPPTWKVHFTRTYPNHCSEIALGEYKVCVLGNYPKNQQKLFDKAEAEGEL